MIYAFAVDTIAADAADRVTVLDALHSLHAEQQLPWWKCSPPGAPPHPSREEFDRLLDERTLVVARHADVLVGYFFHDERGQLLAGFLKRQPPGGEYDGYRPDMNPWSVEMVKAIAAKVEQNAGAVYHLGFLNPRTWWCFEEQCGLALSPFVQVPSGVTKPGSCPPVPA